MRFGFFRSGWMFFLGLASFVPQSMHALPFDPPGATGALTRVDPSSLPAFQIDDSDSGDPNAGSKEGLKEALEKQLEACDRLPGEWDFAGKRVSKNRWCRKTGEWFLSRMKSGSSLAQILSEARSGLEWYRSTGKPDTHEVQFTGYFFPVHHARRERDSVFRYPIYRVPSDLQTPYYTRGQIESGILGRRGLEIGYLDNPVDPYILQVQGSGALLLSDSGGIESRVMVNYAGENGRPYRSLGKLMRESGIPEEYINLQGIKRYFTEVRPGDWRSFSDQNESYVFFKEARQGPFGYSGCILTPKHSIAVDKRVFPMGAIGLIRTERPDRVEGDQALSWKSFSQFVVAQDTGGAIQSPGRVDVFWGEGPYAEVAAGRTDRTGELYFLLVPEK